jgi:hypothetical protein
VAYSRQGTVALAAGLFAAALALRLAGLGWLPSGAGDEGNWMLLALGITKGQAVALPPDAAFVTLLYARIMAVAMQIFGFTFAAARLPNALGGALTALAACVVLWGMGSRAGGLVSAAVLTIHPWSVCYSRICSVPYALALFTMTLGPLLFAWGALRRRPLVTAAGILVTGLGAHFSPLCLVAALACVAFALHPDRRWVFRSRSVYAAVAVTLAHTLTVLPDALRAASAGGYESTSRMGWRLWSYTHMIGTGLAGEATLRHFTSRAMPATAASVLILPTAAVVLAAATPAVRARGVLAGFAPLYFATGLLVMPLVLASGRDWHLPYNHSDRYLFALLPAFVFCMAELVHAGAWPRRLLVALLAAWMALATARAAHAFLDGSGVDHGEFIFDGGGGYHGWLVSDRPRNTLLQVRDEILADAGRRRTALLNADRVFIPMEFVLDGTGIPAFDVRRLPIPSGFEVYYVLLWPDSILSVADPPTAQPRTVAGNQRLRQRVKALFGHREVLRRFVQRDGSPLLELWRVEEPRRGPGRLE